jgi:excisionase family DNA binding protein
MALMDIKEVSAWLNLKPSTLYLWVEQGKIPALKIHGVIRFQRDVIEEWLQAFRTSQEEASSGTVPAPRPEPTPCRRRHGADHVDTLIAQAKHEVYTPSRGKPDQDRATRKGENDGSV